MTKVYRTQFVIYESTKLCSLAADQKCGVLYEVFKMGQVIAPEEVPAALRAGYRLLAREDGAVDCHWELRGETVWWNFGEGWESTSLSVDNWSPAEFTIVERP